MAEELNRGGVDRSATTAQRAQVVATIATVVCRQTLGHPTRVAIDGITASGKSTLAKEVAGAVVDLGRSTIRLTMDGFHHLQQRRYRLGRLSAEGYYQDAYNFAAFAQQVLVPLGPGGDRRFRARIMDLASDGLVDEPPIEAAADAVLIVDGSFLQCKELRDLWDCRIFVATSLSVARHRGTRRDADQLGGLSQAEIIYDMRYHAAARIYLNEVHPDRVADVVVDNNDLVDPQLRFR